MSTSIKWQISTRRVATRRQKVSVKFMNFPPKVVTRNEQNSHRKFPRISCILISLLWIISKELEFLRLCAVKSKEIPSKKDEAKVKKLIIKTACFNDHRQQNSSTCDKQEKRPHSKGDTRIKQEEFRCYRLDW